MAEVENLVLEQLRQIRAEIGGVKQDVADLKELTNRKIGTLAESQLSLGKKVDIVLTELNGLRGELRGLRVDLRTVALAVDEHTVRLDQIEGHLGLHPGTH